MKKQISKSDFRIIFKKILERCGRFLKYLVFEVSIVDKDIVDSVTRNCPHLQDIDLIKLQYYFGEDSLSSLKPIFDKVKKFNCAIGWGVTDGDLQTLFAMNKKLESLQIYSWTDPDTYTFLDELPCETLREFTIKSKVPFQRICQVSLTFQLLSLIIAVKGK